MGPEVEVLFFYLLVAIPMLIQAFFVHHMSKTIILKIIINYKSQNPKLREIESKFKKWKLI